MGTVGDSAFNNILFINCLLICLLTELLTFEFYLSKSTSFLLIILVRLIYDMTLIKSRYSKLRLLGVSRYTDQKQSNNHIKKVKQLRSINFSWGKSLFAIEAKRYSNLCEMAVMSRRD